MDSNVILSTKELTLLNLLRSDKIKRWEEINFGKVEILLQDGVLTRIKLEETLKPKDIEL